jgi:hypothetical protein
MNPYCSSTDLIFVGGTGRSGTTILGRMLNRHRNIRLSKPVEIKFLSGNAGLLDLVFGRREEVERRKQKYLIHRLLAKSPPLYQRRLEYLFKKRLHTSWWAPEPGSGKGPGLSSGVSEEIRDEAFAKLRLELREDRAKAALEFFWIMVEKQINNQGERIWVDTSPPNIFNANRIVKLLPQAKFIHMRRDGRNTIASVISEPWGPDDPMKAIFWWKNRMIDSHRALSSLPPESYLEVQLEEFAAFDRDNQYERILKFLNLQDDLAMRDFFESEVKPNRVLQQKWRHVFGHPALLQKFLEVNRDLIAQGIKSPLYD